MLMAFLFRLCQIGVFMKTFFDTQTLSAATCACIQRVLYHSCCCCY